MDFAPQIQRRPQIEMFLTCPEMLAEARIASLESVELVAGD